MKGNLLNKSWLGARFGDVRHWPRRQPGFVGSMLGQGADEMKEEMSDHPIHLGEVQSPEIEPQNNSVTKVCFS